MANQKISALDAITTWSTSDVILVIDDPGGTPASKKMTLEDLFTECVSDVVVTSSSATALAVGRQGSTNPALLVHTSTASSATGISVTAKAAAAGVAVAAISSGTDESLTIDAKGSGTITLGGTSTGNVLSSRPVVVTSSSANALAVGRQGTTNPCLLIHTSTADSATGVSVTAAAAAAGVAVAAISSSDNESLTIDAKGTGTITLGGTSTGNIQSSRPVVVTSSSANALAVGRQGATTPALLVHTSTADSATGLSITAAAAAGGLALATTSSGDNENLTIDAKGSGTITLGGTSTGNILSSRPVVITSANASALAVGLAGTTNPALVVDASTASSATGISVKSAAAAGGVAVAAISSGTDESLTIDAKGSGTITLGGTSTGNIQSSRPVVVTSSNATALAVGRQGTTTPALSVHTSTADSATGILVTAKAAAAGVTVTTTSSGDNENLSIDAKGTGTITIGGTSTGNVLTSCPVVVTSSSANALAVGRQGSTNPALLVHTSTADSATGLSVTAKAAAGGLAVATTSSGTDESLTIDAKGSGTITLGGTSTGNVLTSVPVVVTSSSANALAVGRQGTTTPALLVHTSTADSATGLSITAAAAAGGVAVAATSSGDNENLTIDAKGSGTITLGATSTGAIVLSRDVTLSDTVDLALNTSTGSMIGTAADQKLGFWGATPVIKQTTSVGEAAFVQGSGDGVNDNSTFGGYTLQQIVQALQNIGILT